MCNLYIPKPLLLLQYYLYIASFMLQALVSNQCLLFLRMVSYESDALKLWPFFEFPRWSLPCTYENFDLVREFTQMHALSRKVVGNLNVEVYNCTWPSVVTGTSCVKEKYVIIQKQVNNFCLSLSFERKEMRDGKEVLIRKVEQYKPLIVCFNGKGKF